MNMGRAGLLDHIGNWARGMCELDPVTALVRLFDGFRRWLRPPTPQTPFATFATMADARSMAAASGTTQHHPGLQSRGQ